MERRVAEWMELWGAVAHNSFWTSLWMGLLARLAKADTTGVHKLLLCQPCTGCTGVFLDGTQFCRGTAHLSTIFHQHLIPILHNEPEHMQHVRASFGLRPLLQLNGTREIFACLLQAPLTGRRTWRSCSRTFSGPSRFLWAPPPPPHPGCGPALTGHIY